MAPTKEKNEASMVGVHTMIWKVALKFRAEFAIAWEEAVFYKTYRSQQYRRLVDRFASLLGSEIRFNFWKNEKSIIPNQNRGRCLQFEWLAAPSRGIRAEKRRRINVSRIL